MRLDTYELAPLAPSPASPVLLQVRLFFLLSLAMAVFMTSWIGGWQWDGILGDRRRSLIKIFGISFVTPLLYSLGPVFAASWLGKGREWTDGIRLTLMICLAFLLVLKSLRRDNKDSPHIP